MKRFAVSIPEELANSLEKVLDASQTYRKRSHLVADALDQFLRTHYPELAPSHQRIFPTVLWKLGANRPIRLGPSPWMQSRKNVGEWKLVELH